MKLPYMRSSQLRYISGWASLLCLCSFVGCSDDVEKPKTAIKQRAGSQVNTSERVDEYGVSEDNARKIGQSYYERPEGSGVYLADQGESFLVAPPIKSRTHLEAIAILVDKRTGEISPFMPDKHQSALQRYLDDVRSKRKNAEERNQTRSKTRSKGSGLLDSFSNGI